MNQTEASPLMVVIGMINGMIGGVILVLPLLILQSGSIGSTLVIMLSGILSYYSCMLCVKHLGNYSDLDESIMHHFGQNIYLKIFYDIIVFLNLFLLLILYFKLIVQQCEGIASDSIVNPIINFFVLLGLVIFMKYHQFGVSLLAYGIVSCIGYCLFLIWVLASAPTGNSNIPAFGSGMGSLAASMGQAFSIQTIFIPVLRKNKNQAKYQLYTMITFISGFCIYMYIAYMGAYGILNRTPFSQNPETIQEYFTKGHWQLYCLQLVYLIHLYSVFPEFLIISSKRLFSIFGKQITKKRQIDVWELSYTVVLIGICLTISLSRVQIGDIIELNGAVIGFFFIYLIPSMIHIKCLYIGPTKKSSIISASKSQIQITTISSEQNLRVSLITSINSQNQDSDRSQSNATPDHGSINNYSLPKQQQSIKQKQNKSQNSCQKCECNAIPPNFPFVIGDFIMLAGMLGIGAFIMYQGIYSVFA